MHQHIACCFHTNTGCVTILCPCFQRRQVNGNKNQASSADSYRSARPATSSKLFRENGQAQTIPCLGSDALLQQLARRDKLHARDRAVCQFPFIRIGEQDTQQLVIHRMS